MILSPESHVFVAVISELKFRRRKLAKSASRATRRPPSLVASSEFFSLPLTSHGHGERRRRWEEAREGLGRRLVRESFNSLDSSS